MKPLYVHGMGLWAPGFASVSDFFEDRRDDEVVKPAAPLLTGPSKRRASLLTRMAIDVFGQAVEQAGVDVALVPSVWAIVHGEIRTAVDLMGMMNAGEGKLSPTRFHNSVYNTASGYASIACKNRAPSVTITGGAEIIAGALVEAAGILHDGASAVAIVWADEPHPPPFEAKPSPEPLALALCVSQEPRGALACLGELGRQSAVAESAPPAFSGLYVGAGLALMAHIQRRQPGRLALEPLAKGTAPWSCELGF